VSQIRACIRDWKASTEAAADANEHLENACHNLRQCIGNLPPGSVHHEVDRVMYRVTLDRYGDLDVTAITTTTTTGEQS